MATPKQVSTLYQLYMAESCDLTGTGSDDRCGPGIINPENSRDESATLSLSEMLGSCFHVSF